MDRLQANKEVLGEELYAVCALAARPFEQDGWDQAHLFENWPAPGTDDEKKVALAEQLAALNMHYPNGLVTYVRNARKLLQESRDDVNPFEGFVPSVPIGEKLQVGTQMFADSEDLGMKEIGKTGFVLVAGGLGERLGYNGIKVALPCELMTGRSFLQLYCEHILALQARANKMAKTDDIVIPLGIMTSEDTHAKTLELLQAHNNFGMVEEQITIVKQELVPALKDFEAHFAQVKSDPYKISVKPHGHGDVHALLHASGLASKWLSQGKEWIGFLQDTNGLVFRAFPAALGVSKKNDFHVNSITVARKPGEAVGGICKLVNEKAGVDMTINVEYNQLDPMLRSSISPKGDVPDSTGYSPYPGNINVLIFKLQPYVKILEMTKGSIPEFVNPKYTDDTKTQFQKPTRLECMMQDYPKLLLEDPNAKVGFTQMERFISFSAVKNNIEDARKKLQQTGFSESALSGESDMYSTNRQLLALAGCKIKTADLTHSTYEGLPFPDGAKVVLHPSFGTTVKEIRERFVSPQDVQITEKSALVLDGDIVIHKLHLDGDLRVRAAPGARIEIKSLGVQNDGHKFVPISDEERGSLDEKYLIRGYTKKEGEVLIIDAPNPGQVVVVDRPINFQIKHV